MDYLINCVIMNKFAIRRFEIDRPKVSISLCDACAVTQVFVKSPVSDLYVETHKEPDGSDSVTYRNDIHLLLNQKRLDRMTLQAFTEYLNSNPAPDLSNLRKHVTDAELHQFVKSRFIQSRSELQAWASHLSSRMSDVKSSVQAQKSKSVAKDNPDVTVVNS